MEKQLYTLGEVIELINKNQQLVITADESLLKQLPAGKWIGGSIPYFMSEEGGKFTKDLLFVNNLSGKGVNYKFSKYSSENINTITKNNFENGFSIIILPLASEVLKSFSLNSLKFKDIFKNPILGYVAGIDLNIAEPQLAKVYFGETKEELTNTGVALHIELQPNEVARVEIINPNSIDENSPSFKFPVTSFEQSECLINDVKSNLADYLVSIKHPTMGIPLVSSSNAALINRDVQFIDTVNRKVNFFSPVYSDEVYRLAKKVDDYKVLFAEKLSINKKEAVYSCLCVSFYLLGSLENNIININGAFTFGEIAYQLLNQTAVFLMIDKY